jgi:hypothetical protein
MATAAQYKALASVETTVRLHRAEDDSSRRPDPTSFRNNPVGYAEKILGIHSLTADQKEILGLLHVPPCRVMVPSGHNTGKTFLAGIAVNYWYDSFDPGCVLTLGPQGKALKETVWGEVRRQRARAGLRDDFIGPAAAEMRTSTDHWAMALTAAKDSSLTGRHFPNMLFLIEEACGVDAIWWQVVTTMFDPSLHHAWLAIFNPVDTTSHAYQEDIRSDEESGAPRWHRRPLSSLTHPNVVSQLKGGPKLVPNAVSLEQVNEAVRDCCEPLATGDPPRKTDVEWPPGSGRWHRPGPVFQARWQGVWPESSSGVWSPALWEACLGQSVPFDWRQKPEVGCDCALGKGDDYHAIHARLGPVSFLHETSNTMSPTRIFGRLKEVCEEAADRYNSLRHKNVKPLSPQEVLIKLDDDGVGNAVGDFLRQAGYLVVCIGAGTKALDPMKYGRRRDELWFHVAELARVGLVNVNLLDRASKGRLRQQLLAPTWDMDQAGRRCVEPKDDTKEKLGRSPDDADAMGLCYTACGDFTPARSPDNPRKVAQVPSGRRKSDACRRQLFGAKER